MVRRPKIHYTDKPPLTEAEAQLEALLNAILGRENTKPVQHLQDGAK